MSSTCQSLKSIDPTKPTTILLARNTLLYPLMMMLLLMMIMKMMKTTKLKPGPYIAKKKKSIDGHWT